MKLRLLFVFALMLLGMIPFNTNPADATEAAGPYFATPSWDQKLDASTRFIVLTNWSNEAVLDRETGLVWEQALSTILMNWIDAQYHCMNIYTGGRAGWRLPTVQELLSLADRTHVNQALPAGHPFSVQTDWYWSANTHPEYSVHAWGVDFSDGSVLFGKGTSCYVWCVRGGGQGVDAQ